MVNQEFSGYRPENKWRRRESDLEAAAFWRGYVCAIVFALILAIAGLALLAL